MAVVTRGSLADVPIIQVIAALISSKKTGVLTVEKGKLKRHLSLKDGRVVFLASNALSDSLGKLLESAGRLQKGGSSEVRRGAKQAGISQADYLIVQKILTLKELERLKKLQAKMRLVALLGGKSGQFSFQEREPALVDPLILNLSVPREARQIFSQRCDVALFKQVLGGAPLFPSQGGAYQLNEMGLTSDESGWLITLDGKRSLESILADAPGTVTNALAMLSALSLCGLIDGGAMAPPTPSGAMAPPPPSGAMAPPPPSGAMAPPPSLSLVGTEAETEGEGKHVVAVGTDPFGTANTTAAPIQPIQAVPVTEEKKPVSTPKVTAKLVETGSTDMGMSGLGAGFIDALIAEEVGELGEDAVPKLPSSKKTRKKRRRAMDVVDFDTSEMNEDDRILGEQFKKTWLSIKDADYFRVLDLEENATPELVRKSYFNMVKSYYADRLARRPKAIQLLGRELFERVQESYEVLSDPAKKEEWLESGGAASRAEAEEQAAAKVQAVLTADAHWRKGVSLLNAGSIRGSQAAFQRAIDLYPEELEYQICFAFTQYLMNFPKNATVWQEAERTIQDAVKKNGKLDRGYYFLGRIARGKDRNDLAKRYFLRAVKINTRNVDARKAFHAIKAEESKAEEGMFSSLFSRFKR